MNCTRHPQIKLIKMWLDHYACPECDHDWLIHPFKGEVLGVKKR
jgi:hypothetical protein